MRYVLKLYVAGNSSRSQLALQNLRRVCDEELPGQCDLSIIDVLENPQAAEEERILATPTLVKESPPPPRRILGDFSAVDKLLEGLALTRRPG